MIKASFIRTQVSKEHLPKKDSFKERYGSMDTLLRMYVCPQKLHTNSPVRCEYLEGKGSKILFEASNKLVIIYICPKVDGPPDAICIRGGKALCNMYLQHSILFTSLSIGLDGEPETIKRVCCEAALTKAKQHL